MKHFTLFFSVVAALGATSAAAMTYFGFPDRPVYAGQCFIQPMLAFPNGAAVVAVVCQRQKGEADEYKSAAESDQKTGVDRDRRDVGTPVHNR
jgi:hypothetical protein